MPSTLRNLLPSFTLLLVVNFLLFPSIISSLDLQGEALLSWKKNTSTNALSSWNASDTSPCHWFGVLCNNKEQVVEVNLNGVQLAASPPSNLQKLKSLKRLILSSANLTGSIPVEFGDYSELEVLDLSDNSLSGEIPVAILKLRKLKTLSLNTNSFEGEIPNEIGNLSRLEYLTLYDNELTGTIPITIGELSRLEVFRVGGNQNLRGELPSEIGNCTNLIMLGLAVTGITGEFRNLFTICMSNAAKFEILSEPC